MATRMDIAQDIGNPVVSSRSDRAQQQEVSTNVNKNNRRVDAPAPRRLGERTRLEIGTRVTVYWEVDDEWYKGTVVDDAELHDNDRVLVAYDDGDVDWLQHTSMRWRSSSKPESFIKDYTTRMATQQERISQLEIGSRISVWWPQEKEYYTGTLSEMQAEKNKLKPHHIVYDDGDNEWTNLLYRKIRRVEAKAERLHVGSRVSVYKQDEDKNFPATVVEIKPTRAKPHRVKYDDEARGKEWLNLYAHPFLDIDPPAASEASLPVKANTLKKRKQEFLTSPPPEKRKKPRIEEEQIAAPVCKEFCGLCASRTKRARATPCHHIFCKQCIEHQQCPLCNNNGAIVPCELVKYDPDHVSFKAVEALDRATAEVVQTFSSASAASLEMPGLDLLPYRIIDACQSKRRDDQEYQGYYWRFQGSKKRILRVGEGIKEGVAIEQVDLQTGEVIEAFPSSRKASEKTGVGRSTIRRVLERRGKARAGGFFWRFKGESHEPWPDPEPTNLNPVEQLDFETGDFLQSFVSLAEAKRAMGVKPNAADIREVCDGIGRATAYGYFWRWKGSQALPNHMMGIQKIVQIRKTKKGKVIKEFRTSREAQAYFGHQCCWSTVCRYCREKGFYMGYYWQYQMLNTPKSTEEEIVGKRLRVQQQGNVNDWLEGKIQAYCSETGDHEILYDSGTVVRCKLEDLQYAWKNDQGQKPVEQLDLKTGQVLASFTSITDAAGSVVPSVRPSYITAVCNGRSRSSGGFFWRYKGSDALPPRRKNTQKVDQLCLKTGRVIATHDTIRAASKAVGITTPGISYCCNGRNGSKSAGGFGWRFAKAD